MRRFFGVLYEWLIFIVVLGSFYYLRFLEEVERGRVFCLGFFGLEVVKLGFRVVGVL